MSEILFCNQPLKADYLQNACGIAMDDVFGGACAKPGVLSPFTPYMVGQRPSVQEAQLISTLSAPKVANELTNLSLSFGGDNTLALAEITKKLQEFNVGLVGASTSVYANRLGGFASAVKEYQDALMAYRSAIKSNGAAKALAKQKALQAFQKLQLRFKHELSVVNAGVKASRPTPLSSATRATNIARSSRNVAKLNISSQIQANNLVKVTQHAKYLGNGLAVIDFTSRIGNVRNSYKAGEEWERELFIESLSFAASTSTGVLAVNVGVGALGLFMLATPFGWAGLIIGGIAIAGTAATASIAVNNVAKEKGGNLYDQIMKLLSFL